MMNEDSTPRRGLAAGFAACAVASATLLMSHPSGGGGSFAELLKAEAANQVSDAFVHGGFVVTLCALMVCFAAWSRMLGLARLPVTVGMVAFCTGRGALIASMVVGTTARCRSVPGGRRGVRSQTALHPQPPFDQRQ